MFINRDILHDEDDDDDQQFQFNKPNNNRQNSDSSGDDGQYQAKILKLNQDFSDDDDDDDDDLNPQIIKKNDDDDAPIKLTNFVGGDDDDDESDDEKEANIQPQFPQSRNNWNNPQQNNKPNVREYDGIQSSHHDYDTKKKPSNNNNGKIDDFIYGNSNQLVKESSDDFEFPSPPKKINNQPIKASNGHFGQAQSNRPQSSQREKLTKRTIDNISSVKNDNGGTLISNNILRESQQYGNDDLKYNVSTNSNFYDPSMRQYEGGNLPQLEKVNYTISYQQQEHHHHQEPQQEKEVQIPNYQHYQEEHKNDVDSQSSDHEQEQPKLNKDEIEAKRQKQQQDQEELERRIRENNKQKLREAEEEREQNREKTNTEQHEDSPPVHETQILELDIREIVDMKSFLMRPCPKGFQLQCCIKRDKSGFNRFYPKYHCYLFRGPQYLMTAKKRSFNRTSNYLISSKKDDTKKKSTNYLGKLRSNFMGTEFNVYDNGQNPKKTKDPNAVREHLGVVLYESNILGARGPRKMKVLIPEVKQTGEIYQFKPLSPKEGILTNMKHGKMEGIKFFENKKPKWNDQVQAYVLNFNGRVEKPSVKNFQLIDELDEDRIYMQFGRVNNDTFNMDFEWPLSPFQAFAISLSSFDYKLACE